MSEMDYDAYDDERDGWDGNPDTCPECGGEGGDQSACIDDLCHGGEIPCMHGDLDALPCSTCGR